MKFRVVFPALSLLLGLCVSVSGEDEPVVEPLELTTDFRPIQEVATLRVSSFADVLEPVQASVVAVYSTKIVRQSVPLNPLLRRFYGTQPDRESRIEGLGSGVIVTPDGYILTNNHVVEAADELSVRLNDGRELKAELIGADPKTDIAVIKIEGEALSVATLANSDALRVGDLAFAVGNPLGIGQTVTMGIVSAKGRNDLGLLRAEGGYEDFIQTDAAINMGNSGGALVDADGRLIGINTAILSTSQGNIGIGFAVPINLAANVLRSLVRSGTVERGFLGVSVQTVTPDLAEALEISPGTKAVIITNVVEGSPAATAGLDYDDVLLRVAERPVASLEDLRLVVSQISPGASVPIDLIRDGEPLSLEVELGSVPGTGPSELLDGVEVVPLSDDDREEMQAPDDLEGLNIETVQADSPYARRLLEGMVVLEINRKPAASLKEARQHLRSGRNLFFVFYRGGFTYVPILVP
jgi:serine protease Do